MAKTHLEAGPFGQAACGIENVHTTRDVTEVTCYLCQHTTVFDERGGTQPQAMSWDDAQVVTNDG